MGRVFYCRDGKRHWIRSREHIAVYDAGLDTAAIVDSDGLRQYELAAPLPLPWSDEVWAKPLRRDPSTSREIATSKNRGSGIEFGAGTSPMAMPLGCDVKYADFFNEGDQKSRAYQKQGDDFVRLSYVMGLEDMSAVADGSLDFVNACHVIEHLRNPLRAFEQVHRKLKPGGRFVLVVPDMRRTFDCHRALTLLEHLIADFKNPSTERDRPHYFEFFSKVYNVPDHVLAAKVEEAIANNEDLHFHTWTYESFGAMVEYVRREVCPWRSVWSETYAEEVAGWHEFYFVLEK
jgi:SAM-dependent methyltransferase